MYIFLLESLITSSDSSDAGFFNHLFVDIMIVALSPGPAHLLELGIEHNLSVYLYKFAPVECCELLNGTF